ncbi:ComF family protein [Microbacterium sp. SA39]|uniref:ComF family protein n=1 Tax=Microbacterium sp. SA39 TaxID=1263625 RepID=UPI00061FF4FB|nr:phosphoribosyltransferase family protein [Microbacterium sp. SA39]KJQ53698.1 Orotate phosphoribosyltransferase [Microbacterium sp. SA39]
MSTASVLHGISAEVAAFLLAASCAGCDEPGQLLCTACRAQLVPRPLRERTPGGLELRAALAYEGVAARCIRRLKGDGETLLARPLGAALSSVLSPVVAPSTWIVPVPTSRGAFRRRGYRVPELLIRRAGECPQRVLSLVRRSADQRGLGARARAQNVHGAMRARAEGDGAEAILVDDVVTTGATLDEAARALHVAGFTVVCAVALAATPKRAVFGEDSSGTHRRHDESHQ